MSNGFTVEEYVREMHGEVKAIHGEVKDINKTLAEGSKKIAVNRERITGIEKSNKTARRNTILALSAIGAILLALIPLVVM